MTISGNSIFGNLGLGIDLGGDGVTPNTPGGSPSGPNRLQPYPVLTSATSTETGTAIAATLDAMPSTSYVVEFFASLVVDPTGFGQGKTYLGSTVATTDATGHASFSFASSLDPKGLSFTATATDPPGNTSEFARDVRVGAATNTELLGSAEVAPLGTPTTFAAVVGATALSPGPHAITAAYAGDSAHDASRSGAVAVGVFAPLGFGGPSVTSVAFAGARSVTITFNRGLSAGPAEDLANYVIVGPNPGAITIEWASMARRPSR